MNQSNMDSLSNEPSRTTLRMLFWAGHVSSATILSVWILMYLLKGSPYEHTWWIILLTFFFGRAAAVGSGLSLDFSPFFLFYQAAIADLFLVLYIFPIFIMGYKHLTRIRYIGNYLDNLHKVALNYKTTVAPFGMAGLLIFVVFPFWSTGPLVGSILGYLIGLSVIPTVIFVTIGNIVAIAAWVWFYDWLQDWNQSLAMALLVLIFALAVGGIVLAKVRRKSRE